MKQKDMLENLMRRSIVQAKVSKGKNTLSLGFHSQKTRLLVTAGGTRMTTEDIIQREQPVIKRKVHEIGTLLILNKDRMRLFLL